MILIILFYILESKIEAQTSPAKIRARVGKDVTLWCNATGYPSPVVYWTREDRNRKLPDGSYQYWVKIIHWFFILKILSTLSKLELSRSNHQYWVKRVNSFTQYGVFH